MLVSSRMYFSLEEFSVITLKDSPSNLALR